MRRLSLPILLVAVLVACGTAPSGSGSASTTTDTRTPTTTAQTAPDFTLQLGDGGRFTLSEETRPVFVVFWAEW